MNKALDELDRFSEDAAASWTLPGRYYFDPDIYAREFPAIFYRHWQYACHRSRLKERGSYFVRDIGDQSVVVLHAEDGEIHAFHNVCQHRAHRLLEGEGRIGKLITCPYHSWCYASSGKLVKAPGSELAVDFPKDEIALKPVRVDELCGFLFINLDHDALPINEVFQGLSEEILALAPGAQELSCASQGEYKLKANWKNSIENYSECYHCPTRHPSLVNQALDISQYKIDIRSGYHRHITSDVGESQGYQINQDGSAEDKEFGSWFLFPNMVFEVYPGGNLTVFNHIPIGPEETLQETEWYFPGEVPTVDEQAVIDFVDVVRQEDIPICESVQRGLHSMGYAQGKFMIDPKRSYMSEHAVHDFQLRVARALGTY